MVLFSIGPASPWHIFPLGKRVSPPQNDPCHRKKRGQEFSLDFIPPGSLDETPRYIATRTEDAVLPLSEALRPFYLCTLPGSL